MTEAYGTIFDVSARLVAICRVANGIRATGATSGPFRASLSLRSLGSTEVFTAKVICPDCIECCNDEGGCINILETWPKGYIKSKTMQPALFVLLLLVSISFVFSLASMVIASIGSKFFGRPFDRLAHRFSSSKALFVKPSKRRDRMSQRM